ncbi:MAG TPA: protein translocase subunit SecD [Gammaproteobacteria bacterium]|nr:protein translocase subunit SecD [Gammaproteobacteria bacterium]
MINQYPLWKYVLILAVLLAGLLYALPNLYGEDPAVQVSTLRGAELDSALVDSMQLALREGGLSPKGVEPGQEQVLFRFRDSEEQLQAVELLRPVLGERLVMALNLAPATPEWLQRFNARPMYLGLDLRGGVHFLMEVDMEAALAQAVERYGTEVRTLLRENRVRYLGVQTSSDTVRMRFRSAEERGQARDLIEREFDQLVLEEVEGAELELRGTIGEQEALEIRRFALQQNITTLRNRVNELGVAEPVIQQQGDSRIVVQLPGVQDTVAAKNILGATATLEYRAVDFRGSVEDAVAGRVPVGSRLYQDRDGQPVLLRQQVIVTGDQIVNARSGLDQQGGGPMVSVTLDSRGAKRMLDFTKDNVGNPMAVVFIENRTVTREVDGELVTSTRKVEEVISVATIRGVFGRNFQTTGLDSPREAHELALLLRAGALAAPMDIIEERTVGPSMGKENIDQGFKSVVIGFALVLLYTAFYYKVFGLVANLALAFNLVIIVAVLSMLQATLTMPGIAGIVLTVGMAVDANVLIFERIREELRNGNSPQAAIHAGYEKAFSTIADANITTLIAAIVLFSFGTGPIKGFAVTLSIGIITSMFTAIMGTRAVINLIYGGRRVTRLSV